MRISLILLLSTMLTAAATAWPRPRRLENRPNILFIHMEDMGVQIPAYGDTTVATPNLDQLAAYLSIMTTAWP